jgi:broad specificity phosphatase PhoE
MPLIQLIRHGESIANAGGVSESPGCIPLSERGQIQAASLTMSFAESPDLIVVSSYIRTQQTAAPLRARFSEIPVEIWPIHEFTYLSPAVYNHTSQDQRTPASQNYWRLSNPDHCDGPDAETFAEFISRVDETITRLLNRSERHICLFTHSFFINALQWRMERRKAPVSSEFMLGYQDFRKQHPIANASITSFEVGTH